MTLSFPLGQPGQAPLVDKDGRPTPQFAQFLASANTVLQSGGLTNARNAKSSAYSVQNADNGGTIALGGNAFYTLTFNAASGYSASFAVLVLNEDTGRGKTITLSGGPSFILWPGQSVVIFNQNSVWQTLGRSRWKLTGSVTLFVDPVNGNDNNDGLASGTGALQTLFQAGVNVAQTQFDCLANSAPQVTIQLADGTHTGGIHFAGAFVGGSGNASLVIQGNAVTPSNVVVKGDGVSNPPFAFFDGAVIELKNMQLQDTVQACLTVSSNALVRLEGGLIFGACGTGQPHMQVQDGGQIISDLGYTISGNASGGGGFHLLAFDGGRFSAQGQTITISANLTFNTTILAQRMAKVNVGNVVWSLGGNTVTGKRFEADDLSMISVFGAGVNAIPGSAAGTTSNGGVCA